jgi:hypothetical protein
MDSGVPPASSSSSSTSASSGRAPAQLQIRAPVPSDTHAWKAGAVPLLLQNTAGSAHAAGTGAGSTASGGPTLATAPPASSLPQALQLYHSTDGRTRHGGATLVSSTDFGSTTAPHLEPHDASRRLGTWRLRVHSSMHVASEAPSDAADAGAAGEGPDEGSSKPGASKRSSGPGSPAPGGLRLRGGTAASVAEAQALGHLSCLSLHQDWGFLTVLAQQPGASTSGSGSSDGGVPNGASHSGNSRGQGGAADAFKHGQEVVVCYDPVAITASALATEAAATEGSSAGAPSRSRSPARGSSDPASPSRSASPPTAASGADADGTQGLPRHAASAAFASTSVAFSSTVLDPQIVGAGPGQDDEDVVVSSGPVPTGRRGEISMLQFKIRRILERPKESITVAEGTKQEHGAIRETGRLTMFDAPRVSSGGMWRLFLCAPSLVAFNRGLQTLEAQRSAAKHASRRMARAIEAALQLREEADHAQQLTAAAGNSDAPQRPSIVAPVTTSAAGAGESPGPLPSSPSTQQQPATSGTAKMRRPVSPMTQRTQQVSSVASPSDDGFMQEASTTERPQSGVPSSRNGGRAVVSKRRAGGGVEGNITGSATGIDQFATLVNNANRQLRASVAHVRLGGTV